MPKRTPPASTAIPLDRLRAFVADRQQLGAGPLARRTAADVLAQTGWARSVGGVNPYLAVRARAGRSRDEVDAEVAAIEICELPAVRGCTYVVPACDFAIALAAGGGRADDAEIIAAKKHLGVTDAELDRLYKRVVDAVARAPLDPAEIRDAVGDAARSLGAEGKKRGTGTTLPLALGRLQARGELRRVPVDGRLDQQRYRYARWSPSPLGKRAIAPDELARELASRFFRWTVTATAQELAWWAGLTVKAARVAIAELGLVALADGDDRVIAAADRDALAAFAMPRAPRVAFVSLLDNVIHLRRAVAHALADADAARATPGAKPLGGMADLDYHAIVDRGRIVGLWDWDGVAGELVYKTFGTAPTGTRQAATALARYIADQLGDARSFSLDSPERRAPRIAALRRARWAS